MNNNYGNHTRTDKQSETKKKTKMSKMLVSELKNRDETLGMATQVFAMRQINTDGDTNDFAKTTVGDRRRRRDSAKQRMEGSGGVGERTERLAKTSRVVNLVLAVCVYARASTRAASQ